MRSFSMASRPPNWVRSDSPESAEATYLFLAIAIDYIREVFDHFDDKTILVIGAGKMAELTLKQLAHLNPALLDLWLPIEVPKKLWKWQRNVRVPPFPGRSSTMQLVDARHRSEHYGSCPNRSFRLSPAIAVLPKTRPAGPVVILDIAVPRDFRSSYSRRRPDLPIQYRRSRKGSAAGAAREEATPRTGGGGDCRRGSSPVLERIGREDATRR